jgi:diguanylate cyclase (GGDEF)-like protein
MQLAFTDSSFNDLSHTLRRARRMIASLCVLTVLLLAWQHYGMERIIDLNDSRFAVTVDGDQSSGGNSHASVERRGHDLIFRCNIAKGFEWPFCKLFFHLGDGAGTGIDMSRFSHITLDADYTGPGPRKLGMMLANAERGLTVPDRWQTYKINQVDAIDIPVGKPALIPLRWFSIAQWWKNIARPSFEHSFTQIDNVVRVEVSTPPAAGDGEHVLVVHAARLHGKWISQNTLLMALVTMWILCAVAWPTTVALFLRKQLKSSNAALQLLSEVNKALELEARELAGQVHLDPLTGVLNRQGLRAVLMSTSTLMADPMSVIFIDIDHFKTINDGHGHDVGDEVLRKFAHLLATSLRGSDQLVRWGGEEFLIICPTTRVDQAARVAESLRTALHLVDWPAGLHVTASFGVAQHRHGDEIGVVIKQADQQLYDAKAGGRDRVHAHGLTLAAQGLV